MCISTSVAGNTTQAALKIIIVESVHLIRQHAMNNVPIIMSGYPPVKCINCDW